MQRIEINNNLSKSFRLIARGLKEIKETAIQVSQSSRRILDLLLSLQEREQFEGEDEEIMNAAILHYQAIANREDAWPEITTEALQTEEAITNLFYTVYQKLQNPRERETLSARFRAYGWITLNIGNLDKLLSNQNLSAEEAQLVHETLYTPMQRMSKLKSFLESFKEVLTPEQQNLLNPVIDAMQSQAAHLGRHLNRHIPEQGEKASKAAELMLDKLQVFTPIADLQKNNFEYELDDLAATISEVNCSGDFKLSLERLFYLITAEVLKQQLNNAAPENIEKSAALKLCRYTQKMLNVMLSNKKPDIKFDAINEYQKNCAQTYDSGFKTFAKVIAAVILSALFTVVFASACAFIGTLIGGPAGTVAGALYGLTEGVITAEALLLVGASAVAGSTVGGVISHYTMFKKNPLANAAAQVAEEAKTTKPLSPMRQATSS